MEELLKYIIEKLVSKPKKVKIERIDEEFGTTFQIDLDDEDKGRIIGKGGSNIKAIREILAIIAKREGQRVFLKID